MRIKEMSRPTEEALDYQVDSPYLLLRNVQRTVWRICMLIIIIIIIIIIIYSIYQSANFQWSKSTLHNKNKNKILNLQNYKTTLSSYKNIIILYNIITNFKKPRLELRFKRRKGITRSKFEWKCIPNRRCGNSKRPATISFKIKFRCRK